jgi:hypothetical protein
MNKIISILISLLFITSIFGIAQTTAKEISLCDYCYGGPDNITVQVGDTLVVDPGVTAINEWDPHYEFKLFPLEEIAPGKYRQVLDYGFFILEMIMDPSKPGFPTQCKIEPLRPGTIKLMLICYENPNPVPCIRKDFTVTVTPKEYPMDQITNILEKNRCKNHPDAEGCEVN